MIKDYKSIFSPKFHLLVISLVIFQFFLWNTFLSPEDFFITTLLFELMIIGIPLITELYRRYNQEFFLKANQLKDRSKRQLQFMLFLIVFVDLWIVVIYHFLINYLFQDVFNLATGNIGGNLTLVDYNYFLDTNVLIPTLFFTLMLITSIIAMTYFLNHFIKNKMFIYGILLAFLAIEIIFGPLLNWHLFEKIEVGDDNYYITNGNYYSPGFTKLSLILIPWNYFAFMINFIVRRGLIVLDMPFSHFFNNTYFEDGLKFIVWYPYVIMAFYFIIPRINKESIGKKITVAKNIFAKN